MSLITIKLPIINEDLISFARLLDSMWVGAVPIQPKMFCKEWNCHNNTIEYVEWYGGQRIIGYYILEDVDRYIAILHSVIMTYDNKLIDITPFSDERKYNIFCISKDQKPNYSNKEIINYKIGDAKMDVNETSFKGISL